MTNEELANELRDLRDFLIIAGYDEQYAHRYTHIARSIEAMQEDVNILMREGRLEEIPGVGKLIKLYIKEYLQTGTCSKREEWEKQTPPTVLELVRFPGIGARTARDLYQVLGISSAADLKHAIDSGRFEHEPGISSKLVQSWREHLAGQ